MPRTIVGFIIQFLAAALFLFGGPLLPARAQSTCRGSTYTVLAGDSLYSIAEKCAVPYAALVGINVEISNPDLIRPGQVIRLVAGAPLYTEPAGGPAQPAGLSADGNEYVARPGDSLARIAFLYDTSLASLLEANPDLRADRVIVPGQSIRMPADARKVKGWIGLSTLIAAPGETIEIRLVDFPPYAQVDLNVGEIYFEELFIYETEDAQTDARGSARIKFKIPIYAWYEEEWVIEAVTTDRATPARSVSPVILID